MLSWFTNNFTPRLFLVVVGFALQESSYGMTANIVQSRWVDIHRLVTVRFTASHKLDLKWAFWPVENTLSVRTGEVYVMNYSAKFSVLTLAYIFFDIRSLQAMRQKKSIHTTHLMMDWIKPNFFLP